MNRLMKIFFWFTGILVVILVGAYFAAPKLINSKLLKGKIEHVLSQKIGGDATFQNIDFSILPSPVVTVRSGSISTDSVSVIIESLRVYPRIIPIFAGRLQTGKLHIKAPDIKVNLNVIKDSGKGAKRISPELISNWFALLSDKFPDLDVVLEDGNFNLIRESRSFVSLKGIDSRIVFPPTGLKVIEADVKSSVMEMSAAHESREFVVTASGLAARFFHDEDKTSLSFSALKFDYPDLTVAGKLSIDHHAGIISLLLDGRDVDVKSTREAALALAGNVPVTHKIFRILKGGDVPSIIFNSKGNSFSDLKKMKNIEIKGGISRGEIFIPAADLNLEAVKGDVVITDGILEGSNLGAKLHNSSGQEATLKIGLGGDDAPFHLDAMVQADLTELRPILKRLVKNKVFVNELSRIENIKGEVFGRLVLGDSLKSIKARVDATKVKLSAKYRRIPYTLEINADNFHYDRSGIRLKNLDGKVGKSSVSDFNFHVNLLNAPLLEIVSGKASIFMDETYPWFSKLTGLPSESRLRSLLSVAHMNIVWDKYEKASLKGNVSLQNGPDLYFDIRRGKDLLMVDNLKIRDDESDASLSLHLKGPEVDFKFSGKLTMATVNKILLENKILNGWVRGDFRTHFDRDNPDQFTANGRLEGRDISLPAKLKEPVQMYSVSLHAEQNNIKIVSADMTVGKIPLKLKGDINVSEDEFVFDIQAATDNLEFDALKNTLDVERALKDAKKFYDLPVKGIIRLTSNSFTYNKFTWEPFDADISMSGDKMDVAITEAALCGISFPGNLVVAPERMSMKFQPAADNKDLKSATACLFDTEGHMRGSFDLRSQFAGEGVGEELMKSLNGDLQFRAGEGRIYKGGLLAKIFAFLNFTEIFRGEIPDLVEEGFAYRSIEGIAAIQGSTLNIGRAVIDGSSMTIVGKGTVELASEQVDLDVLVAPLKTVDYFIKKTPLVRDIFKGSLISIPIKVTGEYSNPEVTYLPTSGVSSSLSNIMKNSLQTPFKIIEPVFPETDK